MGRSCRALLEILLATMIAVVPLGFGNREGDAVMEQLALLQYRVSPREAATFDGAKASSPGTKKVAYAVVVPYGTLKNAAWRDGLAVMAHSLKQVSARSRYQTSILALMPDSLPRQSEEQEMLAKMGIEARFVPVPVPLDEVKNDFARMELAKVLGEMEQLKYYGAALTEYERVVILDGDTMFLAPVDELFIEQGAARLSGIYDHELDVAGSAFPPLNTGFLVYRPNRTDFEAINNIVREGDFRAGTGWEGSHTGWTYGTGSQGVLSFYYNQVEPGRQGYNPAQPVKGKDMPGMPFTQQPPSSRFKPLDRSVYNVIVTDALKHAIRSNQTSASKVKLFHFTGGCPKPWTCLPTGVEICETMTAQWWAHRAELVKKWGGDSTRCSSWAEYHAMPL